MLVSEENRVAIHEVGHAVTAFLLGKELNGISIKPGPGFLGITRYLPDPNLPSELAKLSQKQLREIGMISIGGIAAEKLTFGFYDIQGDLSDLAEATRVSQYLTEDPSIPDKNTKLINETIELLPRHEPLIEGLLKVLVESNELTGERAMSILINLVSKEDK